MTALDPPRRALAGLLDLLDLRAAEALDLPGLLELAEAFYLEDGFTTAGGELRHRCPAAVPPRPVSKWRPRTARSSGRGRAG